MPEATIRIEWDEGSLRQMDEALVAYGERVIEAVKAVAKYFEPVLEEYARQNAPWTDRTGNARQTLHAWSDELANDIVELWIGHGMEYGLWLEVRWGGRYAIVWPAIEQHLAPIAQMLQRIFG